MSRYCIFVTNCICYTYLTFAERIISRKYSCTVVSSESSGWNAQASIFLSLAAVILPSVTESTFVSP